MKRKPLWALTITALLMPAACAGPGEVDSRGRCKTSECIYIRQDDGSIKFEMVSFGAYPHCVRGANWPECKS